MSDEYDELDSQEEDQPAEPADTGPTLQDLKKLRSENKGLRDRLRQAEERELTTQYGTDIVELLPEEVTDHQRRVELAEKLKAKIPASNEAQTDQATTEASQEEPTEDEKALAAVSDGPAASGAQGTVATAAEIGELWKSNPAEAMRLQALKAQQRTQ